MAITRTEIAKQLLAYGGRIGLKKGDMPDRQQYSATQTQTGVVKGGGKSLGGGKFEDAVVTGDDLRTARREFERDVGESQLDNLKIKDRNLPGLLNMGLNLLNKPRQFMLDKNVNYFKSLSGIENKGYPKTAEGYRQYMQDRLAGKIDAAGNLIMGGDDDNNNFIPVDTTFNMDQETEKEEDEGLRLAFRADGGRIGLQEGGGIEQRLEQLGGDVTSAEQMLQGINQRLKTAESSLGSGGGGLGSIAQPLPGVGPNVGTLTPQPRPGPFMGRPILEPLIEGPAQPLATPLEAADPFKNPAFEEMKPFGVLPFDLSDPRGTRFNSIEAAFNNAQDNAMIMRMTGRRGPDILPGEMSFDDYKRLFSIDDEGFITNITGADKFYQKDLTSDPNRFPVSSYGETYRNPDSPLYGKQTETHMGIAKDRYVTLPTSGLPIR